MQDALVRDIWNEVIAKGHTSPAKVKEIVERHLVMTEYKVTLELITPRWKKVLRRFKIIKPRKEFGIVLIHSHFEVGDIICTGSTGGFVRILNKQKYE